MIAGELDTPVGSMVAVATRAGISFLNFADKASLNIKSVNDPDIVASEHLATLKKELNEYFEAGRKEFTVPLDIEGSDFCIKVWRELMKIPYGQSRTYLAQAEMIDMPYSVRAVARANALNKILIIIPCHRIIGKGGKLTGYSGGTDRKRWLLQHEKENSQKSVYELF